MVSAGKVRGPKGTKTERTAGDVEVAQTISQKRLSNPMEVFDEVVDSVDVSMPQVVERNRRGGPDQSRARSRSTSPSKCHKSAIKKRIAAQRVDILEPPVMQEIVTAVFGEESCVSIPHPYTALRAHTP